MFAIKSRVHFRRGFDDSGFAKTILLVEPVEPFLGTVRLDGLPYQNVDLKKFYPYGDPGFLETFHDSRKPAVSAWLSVVPPTSPS